MKRMLIIVLLMFAGTACAQVQSAEKVSSQTLFKRLNEALKIRNHEKAAEFYMQLLESLKETPDEDIIDDVYKISSYLFNKDTQKTYGRYSARDKVINLLDYWYGKDNDRNTPENPRLIEHFRRYIHAKTFYDSPAIRGLDDRGVIYIKYGEPDVIDFNRLPDTKHRASESWAYTQIAKRYLSFDFVEKGGIYKEIQDLRGAVQPGFSQDEIEDILDDMYNERASMGGNYERLAESLKQGLSAFGVEVMTMEQEKQTLMQYVPDYYMSVEHEPEHLQSVFNMAQFRGADNTTKIELYYGLDIKQLTFTSEGQRSVAEYVNSFSVFGKNQGRVASYQKKQRIPIPNSLLNRSVPAVNEELFTLEPDSYIIAITMKDAGSEKTGIYEIPVDVRRFTDGDLEISDLEPASSIAAAQGTGRFVKNGLKVVPYPFGKISKKQTFFVYFEIYGLGLDADGRHNFDLSYKVVPAVNQVTIMQQGGLIENRMNRKGEDKDLNEYISFDFNKLQPGQYVMTVQVADNIRQQTRSSSILIELDN